MKTRKVCTMNCSPAAGDPRTRDERQAECDDCLDEVVPDPATLVYTNWRGETATRTLTPVRVWFGASQWHPAPQWLLTAYDHDKQAYREFALAGFGHRKP